jgi:hypothetical protein
MQRHSRHPLRKAFYKMQRSIVKRLPTQSVEQAKSNG